MKSLYLTTILALTIATPSVAQAVLPEGSIKNVVLVHGAFADETGWEDVARLLSLEGYNVTAVSNPLTGLADDVASTKAVLDAQDGPTVLVGHSWGGVVIGEAGDHPNVAALVYVAAFAPDSGETLGALSQSGPPTEGVQQIVPDDKGYLSINPEAFPAVFAADLPPERGELMAKAQRPLNGAVFETKAEVAAWHDKPVWYVIANQDKVIDPNAQAFFAQRMGAEVTNIDASHAAYVSQPGAVVTVIKAAAAGE
ncbi:MAG: alpha/beta hydrolase [Candidatus Devosia phytovorans]|uniref:Alpha/beta hydrolase n=1 Tax=Candidatus Devosia phytovorans TaxID=3121372 RepID=A0AAJ6B2J7_9HYPH|nr:alpha/beta hydrolase [Devosia sp.]WEK06534.1 MAG: alpha/beta hydrolase [Devosia sp.]